MKNTIIVDNSIIAFSSNVNNGIYVPSYFGQYNDTVLIQVTALLKKIANCDDVQKELEDLLGLRKLFEEFVVNEESDSSY